MSSCRRLLREGALALGASKWKTIATVVVPAAYRGIATGMILGVARIAGETAPLLFTSGSNIYGRIQPAHRVASGDDLLSRPVALRRLASPGVGRRHACAVRPSRDAVSRSITILDDRPEFC